jgi:DNA-binding PadR family transcriptional regulator
MMREMTIYELSRAFRESLAPFYSSSLGSLQVAVRKLLARRLVAVREVMEGRRRKRIFKILAAGRGAFFAEMRSPIPPTRLEVAALSRVSFLGLVQDGQERAEILALIVASIRTALAGLEEMKARLSAVQVPAAWKDILRYRLLPLDYGIMAHRAGLAWFTGALKKARGEAGRGRRRAPP